MSESKWKSKTISQLTTSYSGGTPATKIKTYWENGTVPWLRSGELKDKKITSARTYITVEGYKNSSTKKYPKNTVLIALTGATTAKTGFLTFEACGTQNVFGLLPCNEINPKFMWYFFRNSYQELLGKSFGGAQQHINGTIIKNHVINYPIKEKQNEIVQILEKADHLINKRKKLLEQIKFLPRNIFLKMFLTDTKNSFESKTLEHLVKNLDNKRIPIKKSKRKKILGKIPYYGASGIVDYVDDYIFDDVLLLISEDGENLRARKTPISFTISGKSWVNNHAHVLKVGEDVTIKYLESFFNNLDLTRFLTGTTRPKLNKSVLMDIEIPIPPMEKQIEFSKIINHINKIKTQYKQSREYHSQIFTNLLISNLKTN